MLSRYRNFRKLGGGGMGVVYRAEDTTLQRSIALKFLTEESLGEEHRRARLLREARAAAALDHPNICTIHDVGEVQAGEEDMLADGSRLPAGTPFIAMELVEGSTIEAVLKNAGAMPLEDLVKTAGQIADGLAAAHAKGIVHRDLKPSNVIVTPDGRIKILDFGLAKPLDPAADRDAMATAAETISAELTRQGTVLGTVAYMSPEQAMGRTVDARSDIFSFGILLYEMAAGNRPFRGESSTSTLAKILETEPDPLEDSRSDLPPELLRIVRRCLRKKPDERYNDTRDLVVALKDLRQETTSGPARVTGATPEATPSARQSRSKLARNALIVVAVAAIALGWWWAKYGSGTDPDERTLLILPFEVRGQADESGYAGRAVAEAIAVRLARADNLKVLPTGQEAAAGSDEAVAEAREKGAGRLLMGSLTWVGNHVDARATLLDTQEGRLLWGAEREISDDDLRALAAALTREIASEMEAAFPKIYEYLQDVAGSPAMAASPIKSEVLEAFRRDDFASQLMATQRLVEAYPTELDAWVLRLSALVAAYDAEGTAENRERMEAGLAVIDRIDPGNPYGPTLRGTFLTLEGRYRESVAAHNEVLLREDLAPPMRAWVLRQRAQDLSNLGEVDAAIVDLRESLRLDPTTVFSYGTLTVRLLAAGRAEEAIIPARQALALAPESWLAQEYVGHAQGGLGRWAEALGHYEEACRLARVQRTCAAVAHALQRTGRETDAARAAREAAGMADSEGGSIGLARYHMAAGDRSDALRYVKRALERGYPIELLKMAPELAALLGDPELEAFISDIGRRNEER